MAFDEPLSLETVESSQYIVTSSRLEPRVNFSIGIRNTRVGADDDKTNRWVSRGERREGLDKLEASLALEVSADEQERVRISTGPCHRWRGSETGIHDGHLVGIGAPADVHVASPPGEDERLGNP